MIFLHFANSLHFKVILIGGVFYKVCVNWRGTSDTTTTTTNHVVYFANLKNVYKEQNKLK